MHKNCKKYFEKISEYLDGEVDGSLCEKIERHLQDCQECQDCFESLKKTVGLCKKIPPEQVPPEIRKRLRETLKSYLKQDEQDNLFIP
jgi:RNA polymerase sigma-70 factor (ECF subfamily)